MSYFMKLNDWNYGFEGKKRRADSVFLNPEEIIQSKASNQISSALTPPAINILIPNNVQGSLPKREAPSPALSLTSNTSRGALSPNSNSNSSIPANYNKPLPINLSTLLPGRVNSRFEFLVAHYGNIGCGVSSSGMGIYIFFGQNLRHKSINRTFFGMQNMNSKK